MKIYLIPLLTLAATSGARAESAAEIADPSASKLSQAVAAITGVPNASLDRWIAVAAIGIAIILAVLYLRGIYLVLHYASETYDVNLNKVDDDEYSSRRERVLLYLGSFLLVALSALIISSYGLGWMFLYAGPALTLFGPLVIILSMGVDIRKYRSALGLVRRRKSPAAQSGAIPLNQPST